MYSIYRLSIGEWFYIGCSKNVRRRMHKHRTCLNTNNHWNPKLQEAFNKSSNLQCDILFEVEERKEAFKTERALIKKEKTNEYCCNVHIKEEGCRKGLKLSKATREKISKAKKDISISEEHKAKISKALKGYKHSEASRENMCIAQRQRYLNQNYQCPHCGKSSKNRVMKRWHFDNCKHKPLSDDLQSSNNNNRSG